MSQERKIDFSRWPRQDAAQETGRAVPYLDVTGEDAPIDFLFTLGGEYGLIARANLHTLQGTKKAGKSAAGLALIVAALKGQFIGITASRQDLAVLWIDTEQDKNTLRKKARAVLSMAGLDTQPERLKIVTLRGFGGPADALAATLQAIEENAADFVFLDGVVDLCQAFNDEEKSRDVVRQLEAHAERYGAAILCLIHVNKYNDEARGHLGTVMQQKSGEIYQVKKEGDVAKVEMIENRFAKPGATFYFSFADDFKLAPAAEAQGRALEETRSRFAPLFQDADRKTKGELIEAYCLAQGCEESKAEKDIRAAALAGVLFKSKEGRKVFYSYLFPVTDMPEDDI